MHSKITKKNNKPNCLFEENNINDMPSLIIAIKEKYGKDVFSKKNIIISLMLDYAPQLKKDIKLFKIGLDANLYNLLSTDSPNINLIKHKLHNDYYLTQDGIVLIISWFMIIVNTNYKKPTYNTSNIGDISKRETTSKDLAIDEYNKTAKSVNANIINDSSDEIELVLNKIDCYKETGEPPKDNFIILHSEAFFEISQSDYSQRYGALLILGESYLHGTFGKKDIKKSINFFVNSLNCPVPITESEIELLNIYYRFEPNIDKARFYCESAISHGDPTGSVYWVREFLLEAKIFNDFDYSINEAISGCLKGVTMTTVPPYRTRYDFLSSKYICAVMGQILTLTINDKKRFQTFQKIAQEIKQKINREFECNVLNDWWFEDTVVNLLIKDFKLPKEQLLLIELTDSQRKKINSHFFRKLPFK